NWKRSFYTIWIGQAFSQLSSSILQFAIVWYLTDQTGSGLVLTMAMLMGFLPQGLLGPFVGVYIDRWNRKRIMIGADLGIAAVSMLLVFGNADRPLPVGLVLLVLFFRAIGTAFHTPTLAAVTPQLVPSEELTRCAGYSQSLESISMILSPALAAILYARWSLGTIVLLDVAGAAIAAAMVMLVSIPPHKGMENTQPVHMLREIREGMAIIAQKKGILGLVSVTAIYTIALMPISALFPLMSMGHFGGTSTEAGIVEVSFSIGFLCGSLVLGKWGGTSNKIYTIFGSYVAMSAALLVSSLLPPSGFVIFVAMSALMGITGPFYWGMYTPLLQKSFPEEYLGRVLSLTASLRLILGPLALAVSGVVTDVFGVTVWFLVAGILVLIAAAILMAVPVIRSSGIVTSAKSHSKPDSFV
ncbi:MAG: MFS transporter, partial [Blautia sp.]|nr:MFS transporter [Blautia sp.]